MYGDLSHKNELIPSFTINPQQDSKENTLRR